MQRPELIKLRKKIFKHFKTKAMDLEGGHSSQMKRYQKDQKKFAQRNFSPTTFEDLQSSVLKNRVIFLGDFHTFEQNTRSVLRIIRYLQKESHSVVLALEMVDAENQIYIDAYLDGHITELEFLDSINYHQSWRFPWNHYKLIFDLAKDGQIKIKGINCKGTLKERDQFATQKINKICQQFPNSKVLTLYGELHISPNKLPAMLKKVRPDISALIIHQNLDEVYWKMVNDFLPIQDIVKFNDKEYCINTAPPWVKYESMVYWYENLGDDPEFDIHEYLIENGKKIFGDDTQDNFLTLAMEMIKLCDLDISQDDISDFNLFDHTGLDFIEEKIETFKNRSMLSYYQQIMSIGQSFRIAGSNYFYCSSYSLNRISYLAGLQVFFHMYIKNRHDEIHILRGLDKERKIVFLIFQHLCGYFFSKLINPYRKCDMYRDLSLQFQTENGHKKKLILKTSLDLIDDKFILNNLKELTLKDLHLVSLNVGHILGEYYYQLYCKQGNNPEKIKHLFSYDCVSLDYRTLRDTLLESIDYQDHIKRFF